MTDALPAHEDRLTVRVLGAPQVRDSRRAWVNLNPAPGALLMALVLAGPAGRSAQWLRREIWSELPGDHRNPVAKNVLLLRKHKDSILIPKPGPGGVYVLQVSEEQIDVTAFSRGVASLATDTPASHVDSLLALWRDNPWTTSTRLRSETWYEVRKDRDRLVAYIRAMEPARREELTQWHRFCELSPSEAAGWRNHPTTTRSKPRKRVLIVDDQIGHALAAVLSGSYDCDVVTSLSGWHKMLRDEHPLDYDCALVDRHLTEGIDAGGEVVLLELHAHRPGIPTALMSADLPFEDFDQVKTRLGVRTVISKHNNEKSTMVPLVHVVNRLVTGA
ncbi:hypothetical protein AB5J62_40785 [Amycolatopsis sp. cg5]|uniref:hypothetical protein n=1 Tax=Amycolatopsis sp. cg5 TaxID=3238802 RepID=UPI003524EAFF